MSRSTAAIETGSGERVPRSTRNGPEGNWVARTRVRVLCCGEMNRGVRNGTAEGLLGIKSNTDRSVGALERFVITLVIAFSLKKTPSLLVPSPSLFGPFR